ncbi:MAG: hypothetical protein R2826_11135 [Thermoleophilia bacterium]
MAAKAAFSEDEWQTLRWAASDTLAYLSLADPGFFDAFKEANAAAKFIAGIKMQGDNTLMRELAGDLGLKTDRDLVRNPTDISGEVVERVREAAAIITAKAPEDLAAFKAFILGLAKATAEAAKGTDPHEAAAIAKLEAALA